MVRRKDRCAGARGHRPRRWLLPRCLPPPVSHRLRVLAHQRDLAQLGRQFVRRRSSVDGHLAAALRGWCGSRVLGAVPMEARPAAGTRACRPGQIWASWARSRPHGPDLGLMGHDVRLVQAGGVTMEADCTPTTSSAWCCSGSLAC
jgi:hypothetical protein